MHRRATLLFAIACTACGRLGFDAAGASGDAAPDTPGGHDEDDDGVADLYDVCPYLAGSQADADGDKIGDDCDPEPSNPRQTLVLFSAVENGVQPLTIASGTWTPQADALRLTGSSMGTLRFAQTVNDFKIAVGFDILTINGAGSQHQIGIGATATTTPDRYYAELNELPGVSEAEITHTDGTNYNAIASQPIPARIHTGRVDLEVTQLASTQMMTMDGGWDGERYPLSAPATSYFGGNSVQLFVNNMSLDLLYLWIVTW